MRFSQTCSEKSEIWLVWHIWVLPKRCILNIWNIFCENLILNIQKRIIYSSNSKLYHNKFLWICFISNSTTFINTNEKIQKNHNFCKFYLNISYKNGGINKLINQNGNTKKHKNMN